MQAPRPLHLAVIGTLLAAPILIAEDAATETTPVATAADAPDPTLDMPLSTDLPADKPAAQQAAAPSENVTVNLINRLVAKGILTQAEAAEMIQQAEADAAAAAARAESAALPPEPTMEEEMRVTYIPEVVRNQMRDQIQQELMAAAREQKWSEKEYPEWTSRWLRERDRVEGS